MKNLKKYSKIIGGKTTTRYFHGNPDIIKKAGWVEIKEDIELHNEHAGFQEITLPTIPGGLPEPEEEEEVINEPITAKEVKKEPKKTLNKIK